MTTNVLIVDDHDIVRFALRMMFQDMPEQPIHIIGETDNGRDAVTLARQHRPDIVIMDISLPQLNGVEATRQIRQFCPHTKIIVLSMHNRRQYLRELMQLGISGYVLKSSVANDLLEAIRTVSKGEVFLSPKIVGLMIDDYIQIAVGKEQVAPTALSPRQKEVLQLMVEGKANKEIAVLLNISTKAVESVRHRLTQKLGIDNLADLTKYALQEGLTSLDF